MADFEDLREFERIEAEESWQEVGKKKATPKKGSEDKKSNGSKRENSKNNAGKEKRNPSKKDMPSNVKKEKASEKPKEQPVAKTATAHATPTKVPLSSESKPTIVTSTPSKDTEATIPSSDSAVKRGYSSIVSAMAAKDPTAPIHTSTAAIHSQIFLSPYEFCMKCHDPTLYQEPLQTPLTTRGLINPKNDCFQNCILQALFALPSIRKLSYAFHDPSIILDASLPLWTEFITFGRQFLVNPIDLNNPSLSEYSVSSSAANRRQRGSAMNKDCILASNSMPCLCSSFDTLVHREQSHELVSPSVSLLSSAVEKLQLSTSAASHTAAPTPPIEAPIPLKRQRSLEKPNLAQQDAMEFLTFLLDALHEEARHMLIAPDPETTHNQQVLFTSFLDSLPAYRQTMRQLQSATVTPETPDDDHDTWSTVPTRHSQTVHVKHVQVDAASKQQAMSDLFSSSVIPRLFHGLLRSEVTYKTKKTCSITFQKFHCLTLNLRSNPIAPALAHVGKGKSAGEAAIPLQEALKTYFAEERLENENMRKQTRFEVLPETLILHVGRFSFDYRLNQPVKIHQRLEYPLILTIPRECLSNSLCLNQERGVSYTYRLHAVVLHHGKKATGGHYTTYACEEALPIDGYDDGYKWRNIDDNRVADISEEQALDAGSTVYLLFYVRMDRVEN